MNHKLKNSRVCLAGRLDAKNGLTPEKLSSSDWKRVKMSKSDYDSMKSFYYESLVRSMAEIDGEENPTVCRYEMNLPSACDNLIVLKEDAGKIIKYPCAIRKVQIWFFPFDIVLFSIEIWETASSLSDLSLMHSLWKDWFKNYGVFHTVELDNLLNPLTELSQNKNPAMITYSGTKVRQFQVINTKMSKGESDETTINDELLYEIGSFSTIGIVADSDQTKSFKPSMDYYNEIIRDNTLSVYSNWKALALNDSFTILTIDDFFINNEFEENFNLLYMRCLFEEFYCFDRNNLYREGHAVNSKEIENEIAYMEQHYFFEDMSYNFLPPLMYRAMAKGLELQKDRDQLTQHIKQALREARQERNNSAVNFVQIFAIFSVFWTIHEMIITIWPCANGAVSAFSALAVALIITILLLKWPSLLTRLFQNN